MRAKSKIYGLRCFLKISAIAAEGLANRVNSISISFENIGSVSYRDMGGRVPNDYCRRNRVATSNEKIRG